METLLRDLKYGLRMLRKNPAFTIVAVVALTLGIASTTVIFSVIQWSPPTPAAISAC